MLFIILTLSLFGQGISAHDIRITEKHKQVAQSKKWHKLLHYRKKPFGGYKSQLDGQNFFFATDGRTNPLAELISTIQAADKDLKVGKLEQAPLCAFPARYKFIERVLGIKFKKQKCPMYEEFIKSFNGPQSVSLVFSSAYPNNPASMFGHTFLKINTLKGTDLIDKGVNFAAYADDNENFVVFAYLGIFGGYMGKWSAQPYYVKVNEYVNFENRELWEYELNLNRDETIELLSHFWELETNSYFDYFFFDENCSYQILAAIEAVKPEWDLLKYKLYMIPGESVKNLTQQKGIVKNINYRPSLYNRSHLKYYALGEQDRMQFRSLVEAKIAANQVNSYAVLDATRLFLEYKRNDEKKTFEKQYGALRRDVLSYIASNKLKKPNFNSSLSPSHITRPDLGHDAYSASFFSGIEGKSQGSYSFAAIKVKMAYHDLLNNDIGYSEYAHIDFPYIELRTNKERQIEVEEIGLISTTSLHPLTYLEKKKSWKLKVLAEKAKDYGCSDCLNLDLEYGAGVTFSFNETKKHLFYILGHARAELNPKFKKGYRFGPGLDVGILTKPFSKYKIHVNLIKQWDLDQDQRPTSYNTFNFSHAISVHRNWEIRNTNSIIQSRVNNQPFEYIDAKIGFSFFFK